MPDVGLAQSGTANGTATPATMTQTGVTAGNLLICVIAVAGTSPTIATPTGDSWVQVQKLGGSTFIIGMYILANAGAGSHVPSAVLGGGAVTGWIMEVFEFSQTGANCGLQGSAAQVGGAAQLTNVFPTAGQTLSNELFIYALVRLGAVTVTAQNSFLGNNLWSASVQPQANVQGLSLDFFWASGLGQGVGQYPQASGLLSSNVQARQIAAWFNTTASQPGPNGDIIGGLAGSLVGGNYQGMIGG